MLNGFRPQSPLRRQDAHKTSGSPEPSKDLGAKCPPAITEVHEAGGAVKQKSLPSSLGESEVHPNLTFI